jgi:hypothetical protein
MLDDHIAIHNRYKAQNPKRSGYNIPSIALVVAGLSDF